MEVNGVIRQRARPGGAADGLAPVCGGGARRGFPPRGMRQFISGNNCYQAVFYYRDDPSFQDVIDIGCPTLGEVDARDFVVFRGTHDRSLQRQSIPVVGVRCEREGDGC